MGEGYLMAITSIVEICPYKPPSELIWEWVKGFRKRQKEKGMTFRVIPLYYSNTIQPLTRQLQPLIDLLPFPHLKLASIRALL